MTLGQKAIYSAINRTKIVRRSFGNWLWQLGVAIGCSGE